MMFKKARSFIYQGGSFRSMESTLIVETPIEIIINKETNILIMFSPDKTEELVTGFLFTEGYIESTSQIDSIEIIKDELEDQPIFRAEVIIKSNERLLDNRNRLRVSFSSCGICGRESYMAIRKGLRRIKSKHRFSMETVMSLPERLSEHQPLYEKTGAAHAGGLMDEKGRAVLFCEDIGRHNAIDKIIGSMLIKGISPDDKIMLSSGRASLEMVLKAIRIGIPLFVSISRPTSQAVEAAKIFNLTLIDLAKGENRIYSHARRIKGF